jgi:hypothetical protein
MRHSAKLMATSTSHEGAENGLTTKGSGWWCMAMMEASREEGRRAGEGRLRSRMLQGWRCAFYRAGRGVLVRQ